MKNRKLESHVEKKISRRGKRFFENLNPKNRRHVSSPADNCRDFLRDDRIIMQEARIHSLSSFSSRKNRSQRGVNLSFFFFTRRLSSPVPQRELKRPLLSRTNKQLQIVTRARVNEAARSGESLNACTQKRPASNGETYEFRSASFLPLSSPPPPPCVYSVFNLRSLDTCTGRIRNEEERKLRIMLHVKRRRQGKNLTKN